MPFWSRAISIISFSLGGTVAFASDADPARFVDPFIGTGGHGHTYPGATLPFGMVQVSPDTRLSTWDGCAGYHYSDDFIFGFSHTHLSGVGIADYCDLLLSPQSGAGTREAPLPGLQRNGYGSHFSHTSEIAEPGYYSVYLKDQHCRVELTATMRVGLHRYTFDEEKEMAVTLDLSHRDEVLDSSFEKLNDFEVLGMRRSSSWAKDQTIYFRLQFDKPIAGIEVENDGALQAGNTARGKKIKVLFHFRADSSREVSAKLALSATGTEGATANLRSELDGWEFEAVKVAARQTWNQKLQKIQVSSDSKKDLRKFYTALYHAYVCPNRFDDADGTYRGRDGNLHRAPHGYYTVFSLWDTYRAWHPFMTIVEPKTTEDFIDTFLRMYREGGELPVWDLAGNETYCMNGYHSVSVIADAWAKGLRGFDGKLALEAGVHSASLDHFGLKAYREFGNIARETGREGVSRTLEYSYDDWCLSTLAGALGDAATERTFLARSQHYRNLFSTGPRFFRVRSNGGWYAPFNPREINFNYTEGNAWQYRFSAPHDLRRLIDLLGGDKAFEAELDQLFAEPSTIDGRQQADVTGLIGQYSHGNEPDHHVPFLYTYAGAAPKTQKRVREILETRYSDQPDGLEGNEDCGQMSAWFLMASLGLYQVTPGIPQYVLSTPLFDSAEIEVGPSTRFRIVVKNQGPSNVYLQHASLNGKELTRAYLWHDELQKGGTLELEVGPKPSSFGTAIADRPATPAIDIPFVPSPAIEVPLTFKGSTVCTFEAERKDDVIWYTVDGSLPVPGKALRYEKPLPVVASEQLTAIAERHGIVSRPTRAETHALDSQPRITLRNAPNPQYYAGGTSALCDGVLGGDDFSTGRWQGFEDVDLVATLEPATSAPFSRVRAGFIEDKDVYIYFPERVSIESSSDGVHWELGGTVSPRDFLVPGTPNVARPIVALAHPSRFVRVVATGKGPVPAIGSPDERIKTFLFADEIELLP